MWTGQHPVMAMLAQRLPLTLLLDLRRPDGPDSEVLFLIEEPHGIEEPHSIEEPHGTEEPHSIDELHGSAVSDPQPQAEDAQAS